LKRSRTVTNEVPQPPENVAAALGCCSAICVVESGIAEDQEEPHIGGCPRVMSLDFVLLGAAVLVLAIFPTFLRSISLAFRGVLNTHVHSPGSGGM
jgi:hypothetical protein